MKPNEYNYDSNPFKLPMKQSFNTSLEEAECTYKPLDDNRVGDCSNRGVDKPRKTGSEMFRELLDHPERKSCGCNVCEEMLRVEKMPKKYPIRGWLQGLIEGSATLDEVEEIVLDFIEDAKGGAKDE